MLELSQNFKNGFANRVSNIYPIVIIYTNNQTIRLSQKKGFFDGDYYEDRFLDVSSINEKIDIQEKRFQTNQVNIQVSNFIINNERFTEKFKGLSFTNAECDIFYANEGCKSIDDCINVFRGFVKSYNADKDKVDFDVEDHTQYVLDKKVFPRNKTSLPDTETSSSGKNVYFPVVYGDVEKSPLIFSRRNSFSLISNLFPDAVFTQPDEDDEIDILGFTSDEEPLMILRDNLYLGVPKKFLDFPDNFLINGFDYSLYNTSKNNINQYEISEQNDTIIFEKKISDNLYTDGLPLNVVGRDQLQINAVRKVTGISASSSNEQSIQYGDTRNIRYLGEADGYEVTGGDGTFQFPNSQGDQSLLGYYRDLTIKGFPLHLVPRLGDTLDRYDYVTDTGFWYTAYLITQSETDGSGKYYFDMCYYPNASDIFQYMNLPEEYDSAEWILNSYDPQGYVGGYSLIQSINQILGTSIPQRNFNDNMDRAGGKHNNVLGIRLFSSTSDVDEIEILLDDNSESYFPENIYAWIKEYDDGFVSLRKVIWGTRISTQGQAASGIPESTWVFGLFPTLGKIYVRDILFESLTSLKLVTDTLYSFQNPYISNPNNPLSYNVEEDFGSLIRFDYRLLGSGNLKPIVHMAYGNNEGKDIRVTNNFPIYALNGLYNQGVHSIGILGTDATLGGNWCPLTSVGAARQQVKLDLTFNSLSGNDVVIGSVLSKFKGKVTMDFYRNTAIDVAGATFPSLVVECDAFVGGGNGDFKNDIIVKPDVITSTVATDEFPTEDYVYSFSTGKSSTEPENSQTEFLTRDDVPIDFPNSETPQVFFSECTRYIYETVNRWRENINSINNITINYYVGHPFQFNAAELISYFKTFLTDMELHQLFIIGNIPELEYYADIKGRIDQSDGKYTGNTNLNEDNISEEWLIRKPSDILMHIIEKEFKYFNIEEFDYDSIEKARTNHDDWVYDFSITEETEAKEFLKEFSMETKLIPRFKYDGTFGFINILQTYNSSDVTISASDVMQFKYYKTPIDDVKLMVKVDYKYDYGLKKYIKETNANNDGAVPVNVDRLMSLYNINSLDNAYLKVESKYIRDESTARSLRNYLLEWYKNQHNIIECTLPAYYMNLECGDIVDFDSLIQNVKIFGEDYTKSYFIGGDNAIDGGQEVLPFFMVESISKTKNNVKVKLLQLHKINYLHVQETSPNYVTGNFYLPPEDEDVEETESDIILGDVNFDGSVNVLDVVQIVQFLTTDAEPNQPQSYAADVNQDTSIDVLDIVTLVSAILNNESLGSL